MNPSFPGLVPLATANAAQSVFCAGATRGPADRILHELKMAGYAKEAISVLFLDREPAPSAAHPVAPPDSGLTSPEIRGIVAWLNGAQRAVIPGVKPLIVAGPLAASFHRLTRGGISGGLLAFGLPAADAVRYEERVLDGEIVVAVHLASLREAAAARDVMARVGAEEISAPVTRLKPARFTFRAPPLADSPPEPSPVLVR